MGIFFNLSIWYKLTNKTRYGAILVLLGAAITLVINTLFIPVYGYIASAWAHLFCYSTMVIISYLWSRKHYAIPYQAGRILAYVAAAIAIYFCNRLFLQDMESHRNLWALLLLLIFGMAVVLGERKTFTQYKSK